MKDGFLVFEGRGLFQVEGSVGHVEGFCHTFERDLAVYDIHAVGMCNEKRLFVGESVIGS